MDKTQSPTEKKTQFDIKDTEIIDSKVLYDGFFKMKKYKVKHKLFKGGWSQTFERELFERGHAAAILPYDPKLDHVVLIEQFRVGALIGNLNPWQFEIVAGIIDEGETAEDVVVRESQEEAGVQIQVLKPVLKYLPSAGACSEAIEIFVGKVDSLQANGIHGLDDEDEDIKAFTLTRDEAYSWVEQGLIENSAAIIALQWLQLNYLNLKKEWI